MIDIGHFASEHLIVEVLAGKLSDSLNRNGAEISVEACMLEEDPFKMILS